MTVSIEKKNGNAGLYIKRYKLENGLELWQVNINDLQEQAINARVMAPDAFKQLSENIKNRGSMESVPLCVLVKKKLEIISGHHRIRAARKAGLALIWVLVDTTNLSRDGIRAKQLAHNSLQGMDNEELVQKILSEIEDVNYRIESFVQPVTVEEMQATLDMATKYLDVVFDTKTAVFVFLPAQYEVLEQAMAQLRDMGVDEVILAQRKEYEALAESIDKAGETYNIKSAPTILAKMAEIVLEHMGKHDDHVQEETG